MFKSKARKQAEFLLKVEREKERLYDQEVAQEAARQKAAEDTRKLFKAFLAGYRTAYQQHPKATIISTIVCGVFVLGIGGIRSNSSEHSSSLVALPTPAPVVTQSQSSKKEVSNLATPKQTITVEGFTPAFGEERNLEVWYSVINHQVQLPGVIDKMKQEGRIYFILPGETVEVLETKECLQGVKCYRVNTQGANIMKGNGGSPFKPWASNGLWIPADYSGPFAGDTNNESADPQSQTQESETVSFTPEVTATTHRGTLHSNDGKINLRTGPGTVNKAIGYGINGDRVQILNSERDSGGYTWYKVQFPKSGAIGWIAGQLIEMDSNTDLQTESEPVAQSSIQSSTSQLPQSERFRLRFYEEVDRLAGNFGIKRKYAVVTMQSWETQPEGVELGYKYTCEDMAKFNGDAMAIAQFAYEVNEYSIPLDQLQVFNQAKFEAAKFVGCK